MFITTIDYASPSYDEAIDLRYRVLRQPLGLEFQIEDLAAEYADVHFGYYNDEYKLLGVMLLSKDPEDAQICRMRQVAVEPAWQGKGIGRQLLETFERYAREHNFKYIHLDAREGAVPFYEAVGYKKVGKCFKKLDIPHYFMKKMLKGLNGTEPETEFWYEERQVEEETQGE